jgi:TonB family protein
MKSVYLAFLSLIVFVSPNSPPSQPSPTHVESLIYPDFARAAQIQDTVKVDVTIDSSGDVSSATGTSGHPELRKAAVANIRRWKFLPSGANSSIQVEYVFRMEEPKQLLQTRDA